LTAYSDDASPPVLAEDGVTILVRLRGRTEDGVHYRGYRQFHPGDPEYDELLPAARENRALRTESERPVDPDTLAALLHDSGQDPEEYARE
jgi:hypothetical protein